MKRIIAAAGLVVLGACSGTDSVPTAPLSSSPDFSISSRRTGDDTVQAVARAFAMALRNADLRQSLRNEFQSSRFPEGKVEFAHFVRREAAIPLVRAAAASVGESEQELRRVFAHLPALELYMPVAQQRTTWNGHGDILVVGTAMSDGQVKSARLTELVAFDTAGNPRALPLKTVPTQSLLSLVPVETGFQLRPSFAECDPEVSECGPGGGGGCTGCGGGGGGTPTYSTWYSDELRMVFAGWSYDDVPFGSPEFEVWLAKCSGPSVGTLTCTSPLDASSLRACAGEGHSSANHRYFNYDNPPNLFGHDVMIAQGSRTALDAIYAGSINGVSNTGVIFVTEDDTSPCPGSSTPALTEFGGSGDDFLGLFVLHAGNNVMDFTNPQASDPGRVRVVYATGKTF